MRAGVEPTPDWQHSLCEVLENGSGEDLAVFCRSVISYCGKKGVEAEPRLYSCLAALSSPSPDHVDYDVSGIQLSLRETKDMVNLGTSGLSTWPAGEALANWIGREEQEERFRNKSVLELGAGCGLSGIFLYLRWGNILRDLVLTDHGDALGNLEHNVKRNLTSRLSILSLSPLVLSNREDSQVRVLPLNWEEVSPSSIPLVPDIVIGADLVYHADLLPHLVNTISSVFSCSPSCRCFLACARRETFPLFIELLSKADMKVNQWSLEGGCQASQRNSNQLVMVEITGK